MSASKLIRQPSLRSEVQNDNILTHIANLSERRFAVKHENRPADSLLIHNRRMKTAGQRIKELRKNRKMTQPELAKAIGVAQSSISEIETGESRNPSALTLVKVAKYFEVDPEHLLTGKGTQHPISALTDDEAELVLLFRGVSSEGRSYLLSRVRSVHQDEYSRRDRPPPDDGDKPNPDRRPS